MGQMDGRVALITGAARGQGRSHAVRLAEEGADIIATDICGQIEFVGYPMSTPEDLAETVEAVEKVGRRCVGYQADARDAARMKEVVAAGVEELGRLDTVVVNHGIGRPHGLGDDDTDEVWDTLIATNLSAAYHTASAAYPYLRDEGGSIILIGSAASLVAVFNNAGYVVAKHGLVGLAKALAADLAQHWIRVNVVCPTNVPTKLMVNDYNLKRFVPDNPNATFEDMQWPMSSLNLLPTAWVEERVISDAVLFLAADTGKYITGISLPVDAGMSIQPPGITPMVGQRLAELRQAAERAGE